MKRPLVFLVFLAACSGAAPAVEPDKPTEARSLTPAEVTAAGAGVAEQYRQAYQVRSFEALSQLYAHGLDLVVVHQGAPYLGWTAVSTHLKGLLGHASTIYIKLDDVAVTALGPRAATVVATMKREVNDGSSAIIETGMLTLAVRKQDQAWVIVTEHFSYSPR